MHIIFLSAINYADKSQNYGDCIIIDTGIELVIYDCGSVEHAERVMQYMLENNYEKVTFILSHNDSDHVKGLQYLIDNNKVERIFTTLLLKYKDRIKKILNDNRRTLNSIGNSVLEKYDNIAALSGQNLIDIYEGEHLLPKGLTFVGPGLEQMLEAVAKNINKQESDIINGETAVNATSLQIAIDMDNDKKMLLCGDASYTLIQGKLCSYNYIQLPHHGKVAHAEKIFGECGPNDTHVTYIVSDNTGNSNGGSDNLTQIARGHRVLNTKNGDVTPMSHRQKNTYNGLAALPLGYYGEL